jgi:hypothetical protein
MFIFSYFIFQVFEQLQQVAPDLHVQAFCLDFESGMLNINDKRNIYMLTKPVYKELTIHKGNNKITEHRALPKGKAELVNQQTDKISQQYIFKLHF